MKNSWIIPVGIITLLLVTCICCACLVIGAGVLSLLTINRSSSMEMTYPTIFPPTFPPPISNTPTRPPQIVVPTAQPSKPVSTDTPVAPEPTVQNSGLNTNTLDILKDTIVPVNDLIDLAGRLQGKTNLPAYLEPPPIQYKVGDQQTFWASNNDTDNSFRLQATLRYVTDHVYFWIQDGVSYSQKALKDLTETFENKIYPTDREFFGSEWTPGVDSDPHLYILYTRDLGKPVAGYFSPTDEYLPVVRKDSNGHEMFFLNADAQKLDEAYTYSVLAHEFQHMIHWYRDRNEDPWMNEGFADLAAFLNGYTVGGVDQVYVANPDMQLTDWPAEIANASPNYGASFLFTTYFLDRFGEDVTKALVADPANGMVSIDHTLAELGVTDLLTGKIVGADDIFADWVVANYLKDPKVADGRYYYHNYPHAPQPAPTEEVRNCPVENSPRQVSQYGVDYIRIRCSGDYTLRFEGTTQVNLVPTDPYSGAYAFYSNMGDTSDMTLTRAFDFTQHSGPLTFTFWTWYDLEKTYDYVYLEASSDEKNWQILTTPSGSADNPIGNSYGWGYTGLSGDGPVWIEEKVDISQFAGKKVQLRFEYITDAVANGDGFLLDDISVPELNYYTDFESDDGGWQADGFVRIQNDLPQTFRLTLISRGLTTTVQNILLSVDNVADIPLHISGNIDEVILVVSGSTRFTRQKANYQYSIQP
jgi:immune inhibitor A